MSENGQMMQCNKNGWREGEEGKRKKKEGCREEVEVRIKDTVA